MYVCMYIHVYSGVSIHDVGPSYVTWNNLLLLGLTFKLWSVGTGHCLARIFVTLRQIPFKSCMEFSPLTGMNRKSAV